MTIEEPPIIDPRIEQELRTLYKKLSAEDKLATNEQLNRYYKTFRNKFGPEKLQALEGEELLLTIKGSKEHNSLSYWLEFKNDDEFATNVFGSISGGSAHKYGLFRKGESGKWVSGPNQKEQEVSLEQALEIAREHRRQLVEGCHLLDTLPLQSDEDYVILQRNMNRVAPFVSDTAWGHKYFCLLYPDKLDDFHVYAYQYFHLLKLLQHPPEEMGLYLRAGRYKPGMRYLSAGKFARIARNLGFPLHVLTRLLNVRSGAPYTYWRIGTTSHGDGQSDWAEMRETSNCAIGWNGAGDLSPLLMLSSNSERKQRLREILVNLYPNDNAATITKTVNKIFDFIFTINRGDLVLASEGARVLGVGQVTGEYFFDATKDFAHCRPVKWLSLEAWKQPDQTGSISQPLSLTRN
jgi:5-methylcytosine-specific restriction protein B